MLIWRYCMLEVCMLHADMRVLCVACDCMALLHLGSTQLLMHETRESTCESMLVSLRRRHASLGLFVKTCIYLVKDMYYCGML